MRPVVERNQRREVRATHARLRGLSECLLAGRNETSTKAEAEAEAGADRRQII